MEKNLHNAILTIMSEVKYIQKDGTNEQQGYKFASAEAIISDVRASAIKHGVRIAVTYLEATDLETGITKGGGKIFRVRVKCRIQFFLGNETFSCDFYGEGGDTGDKALAKAQTAALKQALRQSFLIETGEHDTDRETLPESVDTQGISSLPKDIKNGFAALKKTPAFKDMDSKTYREGVSAVIKEKHGDHEKLREYLRGKGVSI